jgi:hypothetical protein
MLPENLKNTKYIFVEYIRCTSVLSGTNVGFEKEI